MRFSDSGSVSGLSAFIYSFTLMIYNDDMLMCLYSGQFIFISTFFYLTFSCRTFLDSHREQSLSIICSSVLNWKLFYELLYWKQLLKLLY